MFSSFVEDDYPIIMPYIYPVCIYIFYFKGIGRWNEKENYLNTKKYCNNDILNISHSMF